MKKVCKKPTKQPKKRNGLAVVVMRSIRSRLQKIGSVVLFVLNDGMRNVQPTLTLDSLSAIYVLKITFSFLILNFMFMFSMRNLNDPNAQYPGTRSDKIAHLHLCIFF